MAFQVLLTESADSIPCTGAPTHAQTSRDLMFIWCRMLTNPSRNVDYFVSVNIHLTFCTLVLFQKTFPPMYKRIIRGGIATEPREQPRAFHANSVAKRKQWSEAAMEGALQNVTSGTLTVRCAALEHNVPKSTLHDRLSGRVLPGAVVGAPQYLDDEEEKEFVQWLEGCAEVGCAKSVREVRAIVGAIMAKKQNLDYITISHGWWDRFHVRHPQLRL